MSEATRFRPAHQTGVDTRWSGQMKGTSTQERFPETVLGEKDRFWTQGKAANDHTIDYTPSREPAIHLNLTAGN